MYWQMIKYYKFLYNYNSVINKQKDHIPAMSIDKNKTNRQDLRVLQRNMVYCSGLPSNLTEDQLKSQSYFGRYGKIQKIVINPFPNRSYCSVYLTYAHQFQAAITVLACNQYQICRSTLWCLFGTMKYCRFFLKKIQCKNIPNCPYLHTYDYKNQIEIQNSPSQAFPEHQRLAKQIIRRYPEKVKLLRMENKSGGELPQPLYAIQSIEQLAQNNNRNQQQTRNTKKQNNTQVQNWDKQNNKQNDNKKQYQIYTQLSQQNNKNNRQPTHNQNSQQNTQKQSQLQLDIDNLITKLILKNIQKIKCSKIITNLKQQQKNIKTVIINNLNL